MKYLSNDNIAVGVESLEIAVKFFEETMGFKPIKSKPGLRVYNTGCFTLYVEEGKTHPPIPSFTVQNLSDAKKHLMENGCTILVERNCSLYFRDPMGVIWDIIEA